MANKQKTYIHVNQHKIRSNLKNNETEPTQAGDGLPYTTLGYMNGRGHHHLGDETDADAVYEEPINVGRQDISELNTEAVGYHQEALIPRSSETHGGEDVAIYASGPGAPLVSGVNEQNVIFHVMNRAASLTEKAAARLAESNIVKD